MPPDVDLAPRDGRTARAVRNRQAVVDALLALWQEGELSPTTSRVAERASVALRTVYGHFADVEALYAEAGQRQLARLAELADVPPAGLPRAERVARFCASRARVLEALLPALRATRLRLPGSPQLQRTWALFVAVGDDEVRRVFAPELAALPEPQRAGLLDALYLAASGPAWDALRGDRGLPPEAAADVLSTTVRALLDAPPGGSPCS